MKQNLTVDGFLMNYYLIYFRFTSVFIRGHTVFDQDQNEAKSGA